jgi:hypothetical protein
MIRFAWLQSRTQTLVAMAGLAVVAAVLVMTGPDLVHLYNTIIAPCTANDSCSGSTISTFLQNQNDIRNGLNVLVGVVPCIVGIFWGAPLVAREIEGGTYRLAWTQSVTRTRWLTVRIGVMLLASMAVGGLLSLMTTWWNSPLDRVAANRYGTFDARDIVPIGYAAFGLALGVTAGMVIRRTLPAMATVLVVFTAARVSFNQLVRPHLFTPLQLALALDPRSTGFGRTSSGFDNLQAGSPDIANAWIQSVDVVDKSGHALTPEFLASACPKLGEVKPVAGEGGPDVRAKVPEAVHDVFEECITKVSATYHRVVTYHPANKYWAFQWVELAIYMGAALVLAAACIWSVRRRRS